MRESADVQLEQPTRIELAAWMPDEQEPQEPQEPQEEARPPARVRLTVLAGTELVFEQTLERGSPPLAIQAQLPGSAAITIRATRAASDLRGGLVLLTDPRTGRLPASTGAPPD